MWFTREQLARESTLVSLKWFEYRFMSPLDATRHFQKAYSAAYRRAFEQHIDREQAKNVRGSDLIKFETNQGERTQLWEARCRADEAGIRYEEYISMSFDFAMRRQRKKLPRPNQLHHPGDAERWWLEMRDRRWWELLDEQIVRVGNLAPYRIELYEGFEAQDAYRRFVVDQVQRNKISLERALRAYSVEARQVPEEMFAAVVTPEQFERAQEWLATEQRIHSVTALPKPEVTKVAMWPSCYALPGAADEAKTACCSCPLLSRCRMHADAIVKKIEAKTGSINPVEARKRAMATERKRRQREKERAAKAAATVLPLN